MNNTEVAIAVLGEDGSGKSASVVQFVQGIFVERYDPNIEDEYRKIIDIDKTRVMLKLFDSIGAERSQYCEVFLGACEAFIFIFSITSRRSFDYCTKNLEFILTKKNLSKVPCILVGNKQDLEEQREVPKEDAEELAKLLEAEYFEMSAKNIKTVEPVFNECVKLAIQNSTRIQPRAPKPQKCIIS